MQFASVLVCPGEKEKTQLIFSLAVELMHPYDAQCGIFKSIFFLIQLSHTPCAVSFKKLEPRTQFDAAAVCRSENISATGKSDV